MARHRGSPVTAGETPPASAVPKAIAIRSCQSDDAECLFRWRNRPEIIAHSTLQKAVTWNEHRDWLSNCLADPKRHRIYIGLMDGQPIGMVRFDLESTMVASVSAYVDPEMAGRGIGSNMICQATLEIFRAWSRLSRVEAHILDDNIRGKRGFGNAGYTEKTPARLPGHELWVWEQTQL